jgi:prefoldin beta subunit
MEISAKMENQINQFEQIRTQVQMISNQRIQMASSLKEVQTALEELDKVDKKTPVYRNVGSLLIKVDNKDELLKDLKEKEDTLDVRVKQLENQEKTMNEKFMSLQESIQQAIQDQQGS